jgi:ABC-type antimicrobial peptide transport system permease subunit
MAAIRLAGASCCTVSHARSSVLSVRSYRTALRSAVAATPRSICRHSSGPPRNPAFALRVAGEPAAFAADIRAAIRQIDPDQPVAQLRTLEDLTRESLAAPRAIGYFVFALGTLAMLLAAIGIYGVMAHNVLQSRREIGIRLAIGARPGRVVGMITRNGLILTGVGLLAGIPLAFLVYRGVVLSLNLFEVQLSSSYTIIAAVTLAAVAGLASWLPALRAARVQPVSALQNE